MKNKQKRKPLRRSVSEVSRESESGDGRSSKRAKQSTYAAANRQGGDGRKAGAARSRPSPVMKDRAKKKERHAERGMLH